MMGDTVPEGVAAFDWDGTLTNAGAAPSGIGHGQVIDLSPLMTAMHAGHRVAIMTANPVNVTLISEYLTGQGISVYADYRMECKMPRMAGEVLVTNRKVLADFYFDDRAVHYSFGDDITIIERTMRG